MKRRKGEKRGVKLGSGKQARRRKRRKIVRLYRPVTAMQIGEAMEMQPFEVVRHLMETDVFTTMSEEIEDEAVKQLGKMLKVRFKITEDPRGGVLDDFNLGPVEPDSLKEQCEWG